MWVKLRWLERHSDVLARRGDTSTAAMSSTLRAQRAMSGMLVLLAVCCLFANAEQDPVFSVQELPDHEGAPALLAMGNCA